MRDSSAFEATLGYLTERAERANAGPPPRPAPLWAPVLLATVQLVVALVGYLAGLSTGTLFAIWLGSVCVTGLLVWLATRPQPRPSGGERAVAALGGAVVGVACAVIRGPGAVLVLSGWLVVAAALSTALQRRTYRRWHP